MNALVEQKTSVNSIAMAQSTGGTKMAPQNLGEVVRFAEVMARADIAIPKHLQDNPGACLAVTMQAMQWEMSPFAVAQKSYLVNGIIAYEAQLISAVINTRAGLSKRPSLTFSGEGAMRRCSVVGEFADGSVHQYESPPIGSISPKNSPLWKTDPDQQLGYYSIRAFGRRHCPEVILGVYDRDEVEAPIRDVGPKAAVSSISERLAASRTEATASPATAIIDHVEAEMAEDKATEAAEAEPPAKVTDWAAYSEHLAKAETGVNLQRAHKTFFANGEAPDETDRETLCGQIYHAHRMRLVKKTGAEETAAEVAALITTHHGRDAA